LRLSLDQAQEAASKPQIIKARVASAALTSLDGEQPAALNPDRIIFLGFAYANFPAQTTVVQAMLFDGSRSVRIAQVPVIVDGIEGERFFRLERPVEGFPQGRYHVDLLVGQETLATVSFQVERP
ncbi:MAG TPA: hypothetical protein VIC08_00760, partial [Cellvibrionaceae bacterium]